jgi:MoaA/NifB/PqqE/SkfB family radical SAM enzyme
MAATASGMAEGTASGAAAAVDAAPGAASRAELAPVHDFAAKLLQPSLLPRLKSYVRLQAEIRRRIAERRTIDDLLERADGVPISINLDLTTACNYKCDHCVDLDILNTGIRYDYEKLKAGLKELAARGLRSVIVIGGGEPTVDPYFVEVVRFMKGLGLQVGIVSNGSGNKKIAEVADLLDEKDWVRLSLDSGTDSTFQVMHKPRKPITLDQICETVAAIKERNRVTKVGFSYIITWKGAHTNDTDIHENLHEMVMGAERARRYGFDYISFKPFLTRAEANNAEIVGLEDEKRAEFEDVMATIRRYVDEAKKLETENFKVVESTNLRVLENGTFRNYMEQPKNCHMQWFRQVMSPLGLFNCPVYRNQPHGQIGGKHAYTDPAELNQVQRSTLKLVATFDATEQCKEVTCLYNHVNWFIEGLVRHPERLDALEAGTERNDTFL